MTDLGKVKAGDELDKASKQLEQAVGACAEAKKMGLIPELLQSFEDQVALLQAEKEKLSEQLQEAEWNTGSQPETIPDQDVLDAARDILEGRHDRRPTTDVAAGDQPIQLAQDAGARDPHEQEDGEAKPAGKKTSVELHEERVKKAKEKKEAQEEARQKKVEDLSLVNVAQT